MESTVYDCVHYKGPILKVRLLQFIYIIMSNRFVTNRILRCALKRQRDDLASLESYIKHVYALIRDRYRLTPYRNIKKPKHTYLRDIHSNPIYKINNS